MWNRSPPAPHRKRKDREQPHDGAPTQRPQSRPIKLGSAPDSAAPMGGRRLLAGYLAHEYLTRGTLLGRPVCASRRAEAPETVGDQKPCERPAAVSGQYEEVSLLLMRADGAHVAGVVNPGQLAQWLRM